jgi:hypothetical protein
MANAIPSRLGQANLAGDEKALFLQVFGGEVLSAFNETNVALDKHFVRTIESGKSASFPVIWKGGASYHTPGSEIVGETIAHNEKVISIDDLLVAPRFIADIDDAMLHYDVRSNYSRDVGMSLARQMDVNVLRTMVLAARASASVTGANGGTAIIDADANTNASSLIDSVFAAATALDQKDVPAEDRNLFLRPEQYYQLINSGSRAIDADFNPGGGNGSVAEGRIYRIAGMKIVKTNNLPSTNVTTGLAKYQGNFATTVGLVANRMAAGTVKLLDVSMQMEWDIRRQGYLLVGRYAVGHGILRPDCAVEIKTA